VQRKFQTVNAEHVAAVETTVLQQADFAMFELRQDAPGHGFTAPNTIEDTYIIALGLRRYNLGTALRNNTIVPSATFEPGCLGVFEMRDDWLVDLQEPFHNIHFYVPQRILDKLAEEDVCARVDGLHCPLDNPRHDPVVHSLANLLLPAFQTPGQVSRLFIDSIGKALIAHFSGTIGLRTSGLPIQKGGLAPWQLRRVKTMMTSDLKGDFTLDRLAQECKVSTGHFARGFKAATGKSPYRWHLEHRVERAKDLLKMPTAAIAEVALACGFADQSHLTRTFSRLTGSPPAEWRRYWRQP
jgi:AraC-like DNA-binding protein